ncbi:hypothetical protein NDU88_007064 [Pleurodeles waltl]|uniref:Uncharacterized protein n=1 Tax=Pleurodeles waltl TaxID=8319 RepID=A0AAV7RNB7_PLEWA|nr:hypothetical protein NDU88_007064 [Pleurodeles waltl]
MWVWGGVGWKYVWTAGHGPPQMDCTPAQSQALQRPQEPRRPGLPLVTRSCKSADTAPTTCVTKLPFFVCSRAVHTFCRSPVQQRDVLITPPPQGQSLFTGPTARPIVGVRPQRGRPLIQGPRRACPPKPYTDRIHARVGSSLVPSWARLAPIDPQLATPAPHSGRLLLYPGASYCSIEGPGAHGPGLWVRVQR